MGCVLSNFFSFPQHFSLLLSLLLLKMHLSSTQQIEHSLSICSNEMVLRFLRLFALVCFITSTFISFSTVKVNGEWYELKGYISLGFGPKEISFEL